MKLESAAQLEEAIVSIDRRWPARPVREPVSAKRLRGDLDAILNKALKKLPSARYASVEAFASDLNRHLLGEPVQARPDSLWYRASRLILRHKIESAGVAAILVAIPAGAAAQAAVLFAIAGGAAVALWQARATPRSRRASRASRPLVPRR